MSMSQFSCKVILFPLLSEDVTCLFFQKDAQETRVKVFGSCWPEIKDKNCQLLTFHTGTVWFSLCW